MRPGQETCPSKYGKYVPAKLDLTLVSWCYKGGAVEWGKRGKFIFKVVLIYYGSLFYSCQIETKGVFLLVPIPTSGMRGCVVFWPDLLFSRV